MNPIQENLLLMMHRIYKAILKNGREKIERIAMHPETVKLFVELLKSKNVFFPENGKVTFLHVPVESNKFLPPWTFTLTKIMEPKKEIALC